MGRISAMGPGKNLLARPGLSVLLFIALSAGLSFVASAQTTQLKVYPIQLRVYPIQLKHYPLAFKTYGLTWKTYDIKLPVTNLTAAVDSSQGKADKEVRFRLSGDVLFDFDKADIRPEAEVILEDLADKISKDFADAPVRVEGHTDAKGSDSYNQTLSQQRAKSVKRWLVDPGGISDDHIRTQGFGETLPVEPNSNPDGSDNPQGRQQNRRVEIVVERRG